MLSFKPHHSWITMIPGKGSAASCRHREIADEVALRSFAVGELLLENRHRRRRFGGRRGRRRIVLVLGGRGRDRPAAGAGSSAVPQPARSAATAKDPRRACRAHEKTPPHRPVADKAVGRYRGLNASACAARGPATGAPSRNTGTPFSTVRATAPRNSVPSSGDQPHL